MIKLVNVSKYYHDENSVVLGLSKVNLELNKGEFVAITGESGSGKSTLLNVISGIDSYEDGEMYINGEETSYYSKEDWELYRKEKIGFIFQNYNLIDSYTVLENVIAVKLVQGVSYKDAKKNAIEILNKVGLGNFLKHKASKLSGGQKQRLAIARALSKDTEIIVADEPTGNLDKQNGKEIIKLLYEISKEKLVCIVTHNYEEVSEYVTRKIRIYDGEIVEDRQIKEYKQVDNTKIIEKPKYKVNLLSFALLNLKNQPKRTFFLFLVAFVMTIFAFAIFIINDLGFGSENYERSNEYFRNNYEERVVISKKDKSDITSDEINKVLNLKYVRGYTPYSSILDSENKYVSISDYSVGFSTTQANCNVIDIISDKDLVTGRMPNNDHEAIISISYMTEKEAKELISKKITLERFNVDYEIVGVTNKHYGTEEMVVYLKEGALKGIYEKVYFQEANSMYMMMLNDNDGNQYPLATIIHNLGFEFHLKDDLPKNKIIVSENIYGYMRKYLDKGYTLTYNDVKLTIETTSENNVIYLSKSYIENGSSISITIDSLEHYEKVKSELDKIGFYSMSPFLTSPDLGIVYKIVLGLFLVFSCGINFILIYVVGYVVIRSIMLAKKKDYSILRTIGLSVKQVLNICKIEIVFSFLLAFILTTIIFFIVRPRIDNLYVRGILMNINGGLIAIIGLFNLLLGFFVSRRFTRMLVKKSIISVMKVE